MVRTGAVIPPAWSSAESLKLMTLVDNQTEWRVCAEILSNEFGVKRSSGFFTAKSCKDEFDRIMSTGHPEHYIRQKGEKYSQKDLIRAWITYLQKQAKADKARETEMLLVRMREKAEIFNRIFSDDNPLTDDEVNRLLEQARLEDSQRDPQVVEREVKAGMKKLAELQALRQANPDKYPPLRIVIPPSRPSTSSETGHFSPIKPLFDGLTPPNTADSSCSKTAAQEKSPSGRMNLRSSSHSPQKSADKDSKAGRSPRQVTSAGGGETEGSQGVGGEGSKTVTAQETRSEADVEPKPGLESESGASPGEDDQKVGKAVEGGVLTPVGSPQRSSQSLVGSPRTSIGSPRHTVVPSEDTGQDVPVPAASVTKNEQDVDQVMAKAPTGASDELKPKPSSEVSTAETTIKVEERQPEVQPPQPKQTRSQVVEGTGQGASSTPAKPSDEKPQVSEKRQLRNQNKSETPAGARTSTRFQRSRKASVTEPIGSPQKSEGTVSTDSSSKAHELRHRRGSATGQSADSLSSSDGRPPFQSLRSRRLADRNDDTEEKETAVQQRRRSDRRRGVETVLVGLPAPTRRKRAHERDGTPSEGGAAASKGIDTDTVKEADTKRRKLEVPEVVEVEEEEKVVETHMEVQSSPSPEPGKEVVQVVKKEKKPQEKATVEVGKHRGRRGSLRSAGLKAQVVKKEEKVEEPVRMVGAPPRKSVPHTPVAVSQRDSDSDEDRPLGDIRSGLASAAKRDDETPSDKGSTSEARGRKSAESTGAKKKGTERHRGRPRRDRTSGEGGIQTSKSKPEPSRTSVGTYRRRLRKEELDESSVEQKAFLTSVWRMVSSHRHAAIFAQPVSDTIARGYSKVVKNRMDLSTLKKQLDSGKITDIMEFKRRLLLMFANAVMFNSTGHDVNNYAKEMAADALSSLKTMKKDILNMKEGAHVTRSAAAAEEAFHDRKKRSSYATMITPNGGPSVEKTDKEKGPETGKDGGKVPKEEDKKEKRSEDSVPKETGSIESSKKHRSSRGKP